MEKLSAIVLAAGMGTRLGHLTAETPKALVMVNGRPIISYALRFLRELGVEHLVVVGGYHIDKLRFVVTELDPNARVVENPEYQKGTHSSLGVGLQHVESDTIILNGDCIFKRGVAERMRGHFNGGIVMYSDTDRTLQHDDAKIKVNERGGLLDIAKTLTDWDYGCVGITYGGKEMLPVLRDAVIAAKEARGDAASNEDVLLYVAKGGVHIGMGDISGIGAYEIDYPEEHARVESVIKAEPEQFF